MSTVGQVGLIAVVIVVLVIDRRESIWLPVALARKLKTQPECLFRVMIISVLFTSARRGIRYHQLGVIGVGSIIESISTQLGAISDIIQGMFVDRGLIIT